MTKLFVLCCSIL